MSSNSFRSLARGWLALLALLASACSRPAAPPVVDAQAVARAFTKGCRIPADSERYVVLLDNSGSMETNPADWTAAKEQLSQLIRGIPQGSRFDLFVFNNELSAPVSSPRMEDGDREGLIRSVSGLDADGGGTDILYALDGVLTFLEQAPRPTTYLFVITDGISSSSRVEPLDVRQSFAGYRQASRTLHTKVALIRHGSAQAEGAEVILNVDPWADVRDAESVLDAIAGMAEAEGWKEGSATKRTVRHEIAHPSLTAILNPARQPLTWPGDQRVQAEVRSGARCVTYVLTSADGTRHMLLPGETKTFDLTYRADGFPGFATRAVQLDAAHPSLAAQTEFEPRDTLSAMALPSARAIRIAGRGTLEIRTARRVWAALAAGLALLATAVTLYILARRPARLPENARLRPMDGARLSAAPPIPLLEQGVRKGRSEVHLTLAGVEIPFVARKRRWLDDGAGADVGVAAGVEGVTVRPPGSHPRDEPVSDEDGLYPLEHGSIIDVVDERNDLHSFRWEA